MTASTACCADSSEMPAWSTMRWINSCIVRLPLMLSRFIAGSRRRAAWRSRRARARAGGRRALAARTGHLPGNDLVLDLVIDVLRHDLALDELVLALVGAVGDDRLGARAPNARQLVEFRRRRRVNVDESALLLRCRSIACLPRRSGHGRGAVGRGRRR